MMKIPRIKEVIHAGDCPQTARDFDLEGDREAVASECDRDFRSPAVGEACDYVIYESGDGLWNVWRVWGGGEKGAVSPAAAEGHDVPLAVVGGGLSEADRGVRAPLGVESV